MPCPVHQGLTWPRELNQGLQVVLNPLRCGVLAVESFGEAKALRLAIQNNEARVRHSGLRSRLQGAAAAAE